jgi:DNA-3-methyladenine glycosylase
MFAEGGIAYVYMIYGFHYLFNVVTNEGEVPHAVLIRAIEPVEGIDLMLKRRNMETVEKKLSSGPGVLSKALGITKLQNGLSLLDDTIWIEDRGKRVSKKNIVSGPRINVSYAAEDALLPYRFSIKDNKWVSKGK